MKKRKFKKQVKRIEAEIERWFTCLGFKWWHKITFEYHNSRKPFRIKGTNKREVLMRYTVDWARLWAYIEINVPLVATLSDEDLTAGLLHEFAHLIVAPMSRKGNKELEEYTVSRLSQIFDWIRKADK